MNREMLTVFYLERDASTSMKVVVIVLIHYVHFLHTQSDTNVNSF